ncbi:hypothetical protein BKG00_RS22660 [Vibrio parahaemolyticus]|nr:hypothetical protein [Vibrio parahaemolyticus]EKA4543992.1 hypothetical protein [Vibrio parahaemolyticus]
MDIQSVVKSIRSRAHSTRKFGKISIVSIVFIVLAMVGWFTTSTISFGYGGGISMSGGSSSGQKISEELLEENPKLVKLVLSLQSNVTMLEQRVNMQDGFQASILSSISISVVRIASVLLAVYLVQILVSFTRYQFRVADHLDATADAFELTEGDPESLEKLVNSISPQHIDFGKMPSTPSQDSITLVKELIKKIPSK